MLPSTSLRSHLSRVPPQLFFFHFHPILTLCIFFQGGNWRPSTSPPSTLILIYFSVTFLYRFVLQTPPYHCSCIFAMVVTRHTRTTKILRELSNAQREDWALEPSLIPTIRYHLLHNFKQCFQVTLKSHDPPDPRTGALTLRNFTPFLASQAEVQNITDGDSLWKQVVPILDFIRQNLEPQTSSRKSRGYPTLFRWFCLESHRSYLFFAFIGVIMARPNSTRIYSARELLDMRHVDHVDLCEDLLNMLKNKLELGGFSSFTYLDSQLTSSQAILFAHHSVGSSQGFRRRHEKPQVTRKSICHPNVSLQDS